MHIPWGQFPLCPTTNWSFTWCSLELRGHGFLSQSTVLNLLLYSSLLCCCTRTWTCQFCALQIKFLQKVSCVMCWIVHHAAFLPPSEWTIAIGKLLRFAPRAVGISVWMGPKQFSRCLSHRQWRHKSVVGKIDYREPTGNIGIYLPSALYPHPHPRFQRADCNLNSYIFLLY